MRLLAYVALACLISTGANAEVCSDRDGAIDGLADEISEHGYDLAYESLSFPLKGDRKLIKHCVKNNGTGWAKIKWMGPKPAVLAEFSVVAGDFDVEKGEAFAGDVDKDAREFKYGRTKRYPFTEDVETVTQAAVWPFKVGTITVQATPLDLLGYSITDALQDQSLLPEYFSAYAASNSGGDFFQTAAFATVWLPADTEELQSLARDVETERGESSLVPVTFTARSLLGTSAFDNQWVVELAIPPEGLATLQQAGVLADLSIGLSDAPFQGLDEFEEDFRFDPEKFESRGTAEVASLAGAPEILDLDDSIALTEWSAVLQFRGVPISGFSFQRFANE